MGGGLGAVTGLEPAGRVKFFLESKITAISWWREEKKSRGTLPGPDRFPEPMITRNLWSHCYRGTRGGGGRDF